MGCRAAIETGEGNADRHHRGARRDPEFSERVTHWEVVPARQGVYAEIPPGVDDRVCTALKARGIGRIYSHQLATWNAVRDGRSVVPVSPTASGKTLAYNLPVLQTLLEYPDARALYLFPSKALSQDQQSELNEVVLGDEIPPPPVSATSCCTILRW